MTAPPAPLTIWCNAHFPGPALDELRGGVAAHGHRLIVASAVQNNLAGPAADPLLEQADVALGQPDVGQVMGLSRLRWVHLTSAGYTRYDREDVKAALRRRGAALTSSSAVYAEPCAEHLLAMMLALSRRLPQCWAEQHGDRAWRAAEHRAASRLLVGQKVLLLGFGAIGRRLAELLGPFRVDLTAVRRRAAGGGDGDGSVRTLPVERVDELLPDADHLVNVLPASESTERFLDARRLALLKPVAIVYNIGRGTTADQEALLDALRSGRLAGAYLDVTDPEPLPPDHPLWSAPNCHITPHTAGGHHDEFERLVRHFLGNLRRFEAGEGMVDRVV